MNNRISLLTKGGFLPKKSKDFKEKMVREPLLVCETGGNAS